MVKRLTTKDISLMSKVTQASFGQIWYRNAALNVNQGIKATDIEGNWYDKEAILVGFSPSLEKQIHILKQIDRTRFVVVCVDVAFKYLVKNDIIPDCVVVADSQNTKEFVYLDEDKQQITDCSEILLLAAHTCHENLIGQWKGPVLTYFTIDTERQWQDLIKKSKCKYGLASGGNVGTIAFSFITDTMEAKRLILLGMEHSWTDYGRRYPGSPIPANEVKYNKKKYRARYNNAKKGIQLAPGFNGEVFTDEKYLFYASWLDQMSEKANKAVYDASIGGLLGKGYIEKVDAEEILLKPFEPTTWDYRYWFDMYTRKHKADIEEIVRVERLPVWKDRLGNQYFYKGHSEYGPFVETRKGGTNYIIKDGKEIDVFKDELGIPNLPPNCIINGVKWDIEQEAKQFEKWLKIIKEWTNERPLIEHICPKVSEEQNRIIVSEGFKYGIRCEVGRIWDYDKMYAWVKERYIDA